MVNAYYPTITEGLNELDRTTDLEKHAALASYLFDEIVYRSGALGKTADVAMPKIAAFVLELRATGEEVTGTKLAADGTLISNALVDLSTAVYLDSDIKTASMRLLNREYAINLVRALLE